MSVEQVYMNIEVIEILELYWNRMTYAFVLLINHFSFSLGLTWELVSFKMSPVVLISFDSAA